MISVVICSIDAAKFARVTANLGECLAGRPHEIVGIHDARSLAEGYNRGLEQSRGDVVVFSHDDVAIVSPDFGGALDRALARVDVVGIAGTTKVVNAYWPAAGQPHLRGWVSAPRPGGNGYSVYIYGVDGAVSDGIQGIDGCLFAARRDVAQAVTFDEATFDGFHGYDIDFSFAAYCRGYRVGTSAEIAAVHASGGAFGPAWRLYAERFQAKYRDRLPEEIRFAPLRVAHMGIERAEAIAQQFPLSQLTAISATLWAATATS